MFVCLFETANVNFKDENGGRVDEIIEAYDDDTVVYTMTL